jgi:hypothetical protein
VAVDQRRIWKIEAESAARHSGRAFPKRDTAEQDTLLGMMHRRERSHPAWEGVGANAFFIKRILSDIPCLYYSHSTGWSEMGLSAWSWTGAIRGKRPKPSLS